jgi:hypothetical protein
MRCGLTLELEGVWTIVEKTVTFVPPGVTSVDRYIPKCAFKDTLDLLMVVRYIYDCYQACAQLVNPCVPSNQPHPAGPDVILLYLCRTRGVPERKFT